MLFAFIATSKTAPSSSSSSFSPSVFDVLKIVFSKKKKSGRLQNITKRDASCLRNKNKTRSFRKDLEE